MGWLLFFSVVIIAIVIWVFKTNTITEYYDSGIVKLSGKTRFGKRDGEFKYYDKNGFCYCYQKYEKGKLVSTNYLLKDAQEEIKSNKEIILQAVKSSGLNIEYASESLKNDREIVMAAVQNNGRSLNYVLKEFGSDREVVLEALGNDGSIIRELSYGMKKDREIVMKAIKNDGSALKFASESLKNDREIALFSVNCVGSNLMYLNDDFRRDDEIILLSLKSKLNGYFYPHFNFLPKYKIKNKELLSAILKRSDLNEILKRSDLLKLHGSYFKLNKSIELFVMTIYGVAALLLSLLIIGSFTMEEFINKIYPKTTFLVFLLSSGTFLWGESIFELYQTWVFKRVKIIHIDNLKEYLIKEEFWAIQYATEEIRLNQKLILDTISQSRKLEILAYVDQALKIDLEFNEHLKPFITELLGENNNKEEILDFYHYWFLGNQHLVNDLEIAKLMNEKRPV